MKYPAVLVVVLASLLIPASVASNNVSIGEIGLAGNSCSADAEPEQQAYIKSDENAIRIIPQQFVLNSAASTRSLIRKKCDVAITVKVPDGYQLGIGNALATGFLELAEGATAKIRLDVGYSGKDFAGEERIFEEPAHQNVDIKQTQVQWSECGADVIARFKVSATLRAEKEELSYLRINSFGLGLEYRECS